jgi:hypothetical protein
VTKGLSKGETYVFRYRAINLIGASEWSNMAKLKAATKPIAPPRPTYISSTSSTITLGFQDTADNGGSLVNGYKLFRDDGDLTTEVNIQVISYNGLAN